VPFCYGWGANVHSATGASLPSIADARIRGVRSPRTGGACQLGRQHPPRCTHSGFVRNRSSTLPLAYKLRLGAIPTATNVMRIQTEDAKSVHNFTTNTLRLRATESHEWKTPFYLKPQQREM